MLGDGSQFGIKIKYEIQYTQRGIADAFLIAENFINREDVALILGDNIFHGFGFSTFLKQVLANKNGATVFGYRVKDPERFGVVEFDQKGKALSLEEKPSKPKSNYAVTGLYFYDENVCEYAKSLKLSPRGELEITDLNKVYLEKGKLNVEILGRGFTWLDTGTQDSMLEAANFVRTIEANKGQQISCLEEIAIYKGFITANELEKKLEPFKGKSAYYEYVFDLINAEKSMKKMNF